MRASGLSQSNPDARWQKGANVTNDFIRHLVGIADACELLACLWEFPNDALAKGIVSEAVKNDALSCLVDVGAPGEALDEVGSAFARLSFADATAALASLRAGHSRLFLAPCGRPAVYASEGPFLFVETGGDGTPPLFATPSVRDVGACMKHAGVEPRNAQEEPSDSVANELSFLSWLLGSLARAADEGTREAACSTFGQAQDFWARHAGNWLPLFMERSGEAAARLCPDSPYPAAALFGRHVMDEVGRLLREEERAW